MARYTKEHKENSHKKILDSASKLFKKGGYEGTGLKEVMADADLTVGTFYAHFPSKADLLAEMFFQNEATSRERWMESLNQEPNWFKGFVNRYLSDRHRKNMEGGCPFPALISELPRASQASREKIETFIKKSFERFAEKTPAAQGLDSKERAMATFCLMIGALSLSRTVLSEEFSDQILAAARKMALQED